MSYTLAYTGAEIDALLGKIDAIFVAEYGSTIYSEVTAAIAAGNKVIVANAGKVYVYAGQDDNSGYVFTQSGPNAAKPNATYVTLSTGNVWSTATVDLATLQQFYASLMEDTASGSIASFPDGAENVPVSKLTAYVNPSQDLHGYANPWPAGGSANKMNPATVTSRANTTVSNGVVTQTNADTATPVFKVVPSKQDFTAIQPYNTSTVQATGIKTVAFTKDENVYYVVFGLNGSQRDTTVYYDVHDLADGTYYVQVNFTNITQGSVSWKDMMLCDSASQTYVPYSNICPISGYTGAEIPVTGFNIWDEAWELGEISSVTGQNSAGAASWRTTNYISVKPSTTYYCYKASSYGGNLRLRYYDENKTFLGNDGVNNGQTFTTPSNAYYLRFVTQATSDTTYHYDISINYPSTDTSYHSGADNKVYSIDWTDEAGTVYGGQDNVTEGELTSTLLYAQMTSSYLSGLNSNYIGITSIGTVWVRNWNYETAAASRQGGIEAYCNAFGISMHDSQVISTQNRIYFSCPAGFASVADFIAMVQALETAGSGLFIAYEARTPQTYQLTPTEVTTLLGDNNIFSSTGDVSVRYRCNTALYIEKKLGE